MNARLSLVTLGVADVPRARRFYEALGFRASSDSQGDIVFFHGPGSLLALYPRDKLAVDAAVADTPTGFSGVTLACNVADRAQADGLYAAAIAAGGHARKAPAPTFWGGYGGYFADPDGHLWEVAHNPFWPLDEAGMPRLPT